jgi:hypothetical protein
MQLDDISYVYSEDFKNIPDIAPYILKFKPNRLVGRGTHVLCFANDVQGIVIKCCMKAPDTILHTLDKFNEALALFKLHNFPILYPIDVINTKNYIIYTQYLAKDLSREHVTDLFLLKILNFIKKMIKSEIKIPDIYHRNFGLYENKLYLYDFHNVEKFTRGSANFMISNLFSLFYVNNIIYKKSKCNIETKITTQFVQTTQFGKNILPKRQYELLQHLYDNNLRSALEKIELITNELHTTVKILYYTIEGDFQLKLLSPKSKALFNIFSDIFKYIDPRSIYFLDTLCDLLFALIYSHPKINFYTNFNLKYSTFYNVNNLLNIEPMHSHDIISSKNFVLKDNSKCNYIIKIKNIDLLNESDFVNLIRMDVVNEFGLVVATYLTQ